MRPKLLYLLLFLVLGSAPVAVAVGGCKRHAPGNDIYKHFVGTIGSRKIVLDLRYGFCGSSNYGGSYFYEPGSGLMNYIIIQQPASFALESILVATERPVNYEWAGGYRRYDTGMARWEFRVMGNQLRGKWYSGDKKQVANIALYETYGDACPMQVITYEDSAKQYRADTVFARAEYDFIGVQPANQLAAADAGFINKCLLQLTGGNMPKEGKWKDFPGQQAKNNTQDFLRLRLPDDPEVAGSVHTSPYYSLCFPCYNDHGFLVMEYDHFSFTPVKNDEVNNYICIDVEGKKIWHLRDIIAEKTRLTELMQREFTAQVKGDVKNLGKEDIVPSDRFMIVNEGLILCIDVTGKTEYPNELRMFLPYTQLKDMLTISFKKRMKL